MFARALKKLFEKEKSQLFEKKFGGDSCNPESILAKKNNLWDM